MIPSPSSLEEALAWFDSLPAVEPHELYLGQKDAQQAVVLRATGDVVITEPGVASQCFVGVVMIQQGDDEVFPDRGAARHRLLDATDIGQVGGAAAGSSANTSFRSRCNGCSTSSSAIGSTAATSFWPSL